MNTGKRIQEIAKSKGVTAKKLGEMVKKTPQAIYDIYSGRVSINVKLLEKVAKALDEPIIHFFIESEDAIYDMIPFVVPMPEIHKLMNSIHEMAKKRLGLVNLSITKTPEGMFLFESESRELETKLNDEEIDKFRNKLNVSEIITDQPFPGNEKK